MKPSIAELFGTEIFSLLGGIAALMIGTGNVSVAVFIGFGGLVLVAVILAPVTARISDRRSA